jgi:molybdopterin synthase sulfur carrier subunit
MRVEVRVFATLRRYLPELGIGEAKVVQIESGTTLGQIMNDLGLPEKEVKIIMRNNLQADRDDLAYDGDRVTYIPAIAGG